MTSDDTAGRSSSVDAGARARVLEAIAGTPSPARAVYTRRAAWLAGVGALATCGLFLGMGGPTQGARPFEMVAFLLGFALVASAAMTRLSSGQPGSMLGRPRVVLVSALALTALLLAMAIWGASMAWPDLGGEHVSRATDLACGLMSVIQGSLPLVVWLLLKRGTDPVHPTVTGAALGMTAGAYTVALATLRCAHAAALHGMLAHVLPALLLSMIGGVLGRFVLRLQPLR